MIGLQPSARGLPVWCSQDDIRAPVTHRQIRSLTAFQQSLVLTLAVYSSVTGSDPVGCALPVSTSMAAATAAGVSE